MSDRVDALRANRIVYPFIAALPDAMAGIVYLAGYLLLDWISFIEPYSNFNITPWNPGTGLTFVLVLLYGPRTIPFLFLGPLLSELILIRTAAPQAITLLCTTVIAGGYSAATLTLLRPDLRFNPALTSMRDLMLLGFAAGLSSILVAASYVGVMIGAGLLASQDFVAGALRYWIGDMIGITVITPLSLILLTRRRTLRISTETVLQLAAIIGALVLVFGYAREQQFQLFYVLFLPIIWMALRGGTDVMLGILVTQLGLILGVVISSRPGHDLIAYQTLMLVLATTGLLAGELVTENRRAQAQLRLHQDSLSHLARLGSLGELAAAIAHELNQPLMAAGTYTRLVNSAIRSHTADSAEIAETANKAVAQVERAAEVIRRLRALVRLDRSGRSPCTLEQIVNETLALCQHDVERIHASTRVLLPSELPRVLVDMLQIEQAMLNLLRNAIEAIANRPQGMITIEAASKGNGFVEVIVSDTGPGFPPDVLDNPFLPFSSSKADGLGFGLPLCKSIIEAHGGSLWLEGNARGAAVHFTLPVAKSRS
jgi:two-component system sensor kinase FixL